MKMDIPERPLGGCTYEETVAKLILQGEAYLDRAIIKNDSSYAVKASECLQIVEETLMKYRAGKLPDTNDDEFWKGIDRHAATLDSKIRGYRK